MSRYLYLYVVLILFISSQVLGQVYSNHGGWVRLNQQVISSNSFFDSDSQPMAIRTNTIYITSITAEVGLTNRLTSTICFPFFVRSLLNQVEFNQSGTHFPGASLNALGDADIGFRLALRNKMPIQVISFASVGLPLGRKLKLGTDADLQTGDGEFNQIVGVQLLQTFKNVRLLGYASFNNRSKNFSNEIRYGIEIKYRGNYKIGAQFQFNAVESLFNDVARVSLSGIFSNHRELFAPSLELDYSLSKAISAFIAGDFIIAGRNTLRAPLWRTGIQFNLRASR